MATTQLDAERVRYAAQRVGNELKAEKIGAKNKWLADYMAKPIACGFLWRKQRFPDAAEAEHAYTFSGDMYFAPATKHALMFNERIALAERIEKIAIAALVLGESSLVTLDDREIRFLKLDVR
jgi:hypothetical protein